MDTQKKNQQQIHKVLIIAISLLFSCSSKEEVKDEMQSPFNDAKYSFSWCKTLIPYDKNSLEKGDGQAWINIAVRVINLSDSDSLIIRNSSGTGIISHFYYYYSNNKSYLHTNQNKIITIQPKDTFYFNLTSTKFIGLYNYKVSSFLKNIESDLKNMELYYENDQKEIIENDYSIKVKTKILKSKDYKIEYLNIDEGEE